MLRMGVRGDNHRFLSDTWKNLRVEDGGEGDNHRFLSDTWKNLNIEDGGEGG